MTKKKVIVADPALAKHQTAPPVPPVPPIAQTTAKSTGPSNPPPAAGADRTWIDLHPERVWPD